MKKLSLILVAVLCLACLIGCGCPKKRVVRSGSPEAEPSLTMHVECTSGPNWNHTATGEDVEQLRAVYYAVTQAIADGNAVVRYEWGGSGFTIKTEDIIQVTIN